MPESNFQPFQTTQQDATNVGPQIPPEEQAREDAIAEAHINAGIDHFTHVGTSTLEGAGVGFVTGVGTGPGALPSTVAGAIIGMNVGNVTGAYNNCGNCHLQHPPQEPPVPEIETEDHEKKRDELLKELSGNP